MLLEFVLCMRAFLEFVSVLPAGAAAAELLLLKLQSQDKEGTQPDQPRSLDLRSRALAAIQLRWLWLVILRRSSICMKYNNQHFTICMYIWLVF